MHVDFDDKLNAADCYDMCISTTQSNLPLSLPFGSYTDS